MYFPSTFDLELLTINILRALRIKRLLPLALFLTCSGVCVAQNDMTNHIKNPSFENGGADGWVQTGLQTQSNSVFKKKAGNVYMENGRDAAVPSVMLKSVKHSSDLNQVATN